MRAAKQRETRMRRKPMRNVTDAEVKLWLVLRSRKLGGFKFIRQGKIGRYAIDFVCREKYLAVEIDNANAAGPKDRLRGMALAAKGYIVLRYGHADVVNNLDSVIGNLYAELCAR